MYLVDVLAIYGAVVGTLAIAWQIYTWRRDRALRVKILAEELDDYTGGPGYVPIIVGRVINMSSHPIRVIATSLMNAAEQFVPIYYSSSYGVPVVIPPRDAAELRFPVLDFLRPPDDDELEDEELDFSMSDPPVNPAEPVVVWVKLSTGEQFRSQPLDLPRRWSQVLSAG